jgi:hypothetical protein
MARIPAEFQNHELPMRIWSFINVLVSSDFSFNVEGNRDVICLLLFHSIENVLVREHLNFSGLKHTVKSRYMSKRKKIIRMKNKYFQIISV